MTGSHVVQAPVEPVEGPPAEPKRAKPSELWPYLRPHAKVLVPTAGISLVAAVLYLVQPALVSRVIAAVSTQQPLGNLVLLLVAVVLGAAIIGGVQQYLLQRTAEAVVLTTRQHLVSRILRLPIPDFDTRRTGDLVSRVGADTTLLRSVVTEGLVDAAAGLLVFIGSIVAMALIDIVLLALTLAVVLATVIIVVSLGGRIQKLTVEGQTQVGNLASGVARAVPGIRTIRAARATERETAELDRLAHNAFGVGIRLAKLMAMVGPIIGLALQGAFILVLGVGGYRVASGAMAVSDLVGFILYLFMMIMPLGQAFQAYTAIQNALGAVVRIREITDLPAEADPPAGGSRVVGHLEPAGSTAVEFDHVSFGYGGAESGTVPVLKDVSFTVPIGSRTAIVGPSGAGKSTILALIERFYDPSDGVIRLSGVDVREQSRSQVRARLGYVEQDAPVLAGTFRENLLIGAPEADTAACTEVLAQVRLTEVLDRDPRGLDAPVGEDGILLSGGERQRLAIARALLARPPVLLLDEPTASLDSRNEQALRGAIDAVAQQRTLIVVAHRLATVADADQIIVLDKGQVQAVGTHQELLRANDLYRELAQHQMLA